MNNILILDKREKDLVRDMRTRQIIALKLLAYEEEDRFEVIKNGFNGKTGYMSKHDFLKILKEWYVERQG